MTNLKLLRNKFSKWKKTKKAKQVIALIYEKQDKKCAICYRKLIFWKEKTVWELLEMMARGEHIDINRYVELDHIMPLSKGGTHDPKNLQIVCSSCNSRKGAKYLEN